MDLEAVYIIGTRIGAFVLFPATRSILSNKEEFNNVISLFENNLKLLLKGLKHYSLSKETQTEIRKFQREIRDVKDKPYSMLQIENLMDIFNRLSDKLSIWNERLFKEFSDIILTQPYLKGSLNYKKIIDGVEGFFTSNVWDNMQEIEKKDLEDFRICYLHQAWTAAGIMVMRVIESAVREYYKRFTNELRTNWWAILADLKRNYPNSNQDLIEKLDYIREHIRNPLVHPELRIEAHETEEAFLQAIQVLTIIYG